MEENILWFRWIFFKDVFWFFKSNGGKIDRWFWEILSFVKKCKFLNKFLEIILFVNFRWIFIVYNFWIFFIFWNILGCIFLNLFWDKLRIIKDEKLNIFLNIRGKLVFVRYKFCNCFFVNFIWKGLKLMLWM